MKVSGFTFIRNAVKYDFPIIEAIQSALPIVDEFIVNVGNSEDATLELIQSIQSEKIRIIESIWDDTLRRDGRVFGMQQDIALSHCTGDWALLLQADEVLHEHDYPIIQSSVQKCSDRPEVLGLVFRVLHFKGDFWSIDPWMYRKATRLIRNHRGVCSAPDGCDFTAESGGPMIKSGRLGYVIPARIFHYGWVKHTNTLRDKVEFQKTRHEGESRSYDEIRASASMLAEIPNYDVLKTFHGIHPRVMNHRVSGASMLRPRRNRWLNWKFYREVVSRGFKG